MQHATLLAPASPSVSLVNDRPATTSLEVAKFFGKRHDHVVRDIDNLMLQVPENFLQPNFGETAYQQETPMGVKQSRMFILYRDGFMLLVMGYTGKKAMQIKIAYIEAFNQMEAKLSTKPALPSTITPSTAADRRPLDKLVKVWAQQSGTVHAQAWTQVNAHFNLDSVTQLPIEWIPDAIAFVQAKIDALARIEAKPEQEALPQAGLPAIRVKRLPGPVAAELRRLQDDLSYLHARTRQEFTALVGRVHNLASPLSHGVYQALGWHGTLGFSVDGLADGLGQSHYVSIRQFDDAFSEAHIYVRQFWTLARMLEK